MTNIATIIKDIKETATPMMNKWIEDRVVYVMALKAIYKALDSDEEFAAEYAEARAYDR